MLKLFAAASNYVMTIRTYQTRNSIETLFLPISYGIRIIYCIYKLANADLLIITRELVNRLHFTHRKVTKT